MRLSNIKLLNFKNYQSLQQSFESKLVLFHGANGEGKTNLMDAIYFACLSKSYFNMADKHLVCHDQLYFRVDAEYISDTEDSCQICYKYKINQKKVIKLEGDQLVSPIELMGKFPIVFIAPDDSKIMRDGSLERRDFVNRILCQTDLEYLRSLIKYRQLLKQKDSALKNERQPDPLVIDSFNARLVPLAAEIHQKRKAFTQFLTVSTSKIYEHISDSRETVDIDYQSQLNETSVEKLFLQNQRDEIMMRRTLVGTHKDDFVFSINGRPFKKYGSQGQNKSFLYALRLSEYEYLKQSLMVTPILMLDDYFEKLDGTRLSHLLDIISSDQFGQIFLSDTELLRSKSMFEELGIHFQAIKIER